MTAMKKNYLFLIALFLPLLSFGQISFTNSNAALGYGSYYSGVAIGVMDMNSDGLDDIVHLDDGNYLMIEYQQADGTFLHVPITSVASDSEWSMSVADVDNDGHGDVLTGGYYNNIKVVRISNNGADFELSTMPGPDLFAQCSNFADINNDGWLDAFVCHDDAESRIWGNNGDGTFSMADDWIDMSTLPPSDNSGNYGSVWTDFDDDGDLDLYIAKCRQGVSDPTDPRRINALFVNLGNNNYVESAGSFGLKIGAQSWTAEFGDIDNDGDFDCFITNHDVPNMLLENDGTGHFTDITASSGLPATAFPIQGLMRDFDNDGYLDILVAGASHHLFRNNGDKTFTEVDILSDLQMESFALGDLNHDGYIDIYAGYADIYTSPGNDPDIIWLNDGGTDNHFLTLSLEGTLSNRSAVGAKVKIFGPWGVQVREVRAGESYGISNSLALHFGLGEATEVDSLVVYWPAGGETVLTGVPADQFLHIEESGCVVSNVEVSADGSTTFCSGESVTLSGPDGALAYLWNTGDTTQSILVSEAGAYSVEITDSLGCMGSSPVMEVVVDPDETPGITLLGEESFCYGESAVLTSTPAPSYLWSTGDTTQSIEITQSGTYFVEVQGLCNTFQSASVDIFVFEPELPEVQNDTFTQAGETATLMAEVSSGGLVWYDMPGVSLVGVGNVFTTPPLFATTTYYVVNVDTLEAPGLYNAGQAEPTGDELYSGNQYNGALLFDAYKPFVLQSVTVYTDTEGQREIVLLDAGNNVLQSLLIDVPEGQSTIELNFEVPQAEGLQLTTNGTVNQQQLGFESPRFQRSKGDEVVYPYEVPDVLSIFNTNFGEEHYYYFYDWQVMVPGKFCESEPVEVLAVYNPDVAVDDVLLQDFWLSPNPTQGELYLSWGQALSADARLLLFDAQGRELRALSLPEGSREYFLQVQSLAPGVYTLLVRSERGFWRQQFVKE